MGPRHRYLFVGGLHRSGTSLVARLAASLPGCAGILGAPVPENEGAYLQGGIPHDALAGRPMHFATDPAQHMTETHPLNRLETRQRIAADWDPWYPEDAPWRVEKSPVNLTRTRLLQQLFPLSQFVIVLRHPEAVAASAGGWTDAPGPRLLDHWIAAHGIVAGDLRHLHAVLVLRYEDVVAAPERALGRLAAFLGIAAAPHRVPEPIRDGNDARPAPARLSRRQARAASRWGYGPGLGVEAGWSFPPRHPLRSVREALSALDGPPEGDRRADPGPKSAS